MTDAWHWPQWTTLILAVLNLLATAALNGKPKTGEHNFALALCGAAIGQWILWAGGFWK